jgi:hypothetical protein
LAAVARAVASKDDPATVLEVDLVDDARVGGTTEKPSNASWPQRRKA